MRMLILLWLGLAGATAGADCQPAAADVERSLNALRAQARVCGERSLPAAPALRWQVLLAAAAQRHAQDLAARDRLDHLSADGASLRMRLRAAGYAMRLAGENLAGGAATLDEALAQWLASPAHCENLMLAEVQEVGLACVTGPGQLQRYWVLQVAAPARARPNALPTPSPTGS